MHWTVECILFVVILVQDLILPMRESILPILLFHKNTPNSKEYLHLINIGITKNKESQVYEKWPELLSLIASISFISITTMNNDINNSRKNNNWSIFHGDTKYIFSVISTFSQIVFVDVANYSIGYQILNYFHSTYIHIYGCCYDVHGKKKYGSTICCCNRTYPIQSKRLYILPIQLSFQL